jgi:hypothetical protein
MSEYKFGPIGSIVDLRTYRRWLPDKKRRETLEDRNKRAVDYNIGLALNAPNIDPNLENDRAMMFDYMNNFLAFPSGRSMWVGGTPVTERHPAGSFNCSALAINRVSAFTTIFELLMLGTGVGYRVFSSDIEKLPEVNLQNVSLSFEDYIPRLPNNRIEDTYCQVVENNDEAVTKTWKIFVGDSRQGWIDALNYLLDAAFFEECPPEYIQYNVDSIRPMGERIYGFGGTASGPEALKGIIEDVFRVIQECPTSKLRSIDCMDIADCIAKGVVAGSSRRSALICLFEEGDDLCANAKRGLFTNPELAHKQYRIQSNNTECIGVKGLQELRMLLEADPDVDWKVIKALINKYKPSVEWLKKRFEVVRYEGEPGFNNFLYMVARRWKAVRKWRPSCPTNEIWVRYCDVVTNPCHEIILSTGYSQELKDCGYGVSFCNLTTHPLQNFVENGKLNYDLLERAIRSGVRIGLRQTCVIMPRPELNDTQIEERLLGVSATGWRMLFDILGWDTASPEVVDLQLKMNEWANDEATNYSKVLGVPRPLLVTCIKPEGCLDKEALRVTDQGILTADEVNPNIYFDYGFSEDISGYSRDGLTIPRTYNSGASEGIKITLQNGRTLLSTKAHPFSVDGQWVEAQFIVPGQVLDFQLGTYSNKVEAPLKDVDFSLFDNSGGQFEADIYKTPQFMTPDLAWLVGNYFANGCFTESKSRIKLHCQRLDIHDKAQKIWLDLFGFSTNIIKSSDRDSYNQDFGSVYLMEWFKANGLYKEPKAYLTRIPRVIRESSYESVIAFIAGLADGDGCFYGDSFCIDNKSSEFIRHIQQVGESVGLSLSHIENSQRNGHSEGSIFKCHASRTYSLGWAFDLLNKHSVKAIEKPVSTSDHKNKARNPYVVVANESAGVINTYDVEVSEEHWYYAGGIKSHNTGSKVFGSTDGLHWDWAPYYIRRIQMATTDALARTLKKQGFPWNPKDYDLNRLIEPERTYQPTKLDKILILFGLKKKPLNLWDRVKIFNKMSDQEKDGMFADSNAVTFDFPIKSPARIAGGSVSAIEQLENVKTFTENYTDHMPSSTITVKDYEWDDIAQWIHNNWDTYVTASLFSYFNGSYPLLPYEDITEEEYHSLVDQFDPKYITTINGRVTFMVDEELMAREERKDLEEDIDIDAIDLSGGCSSGACPVR